MEHTHTNKIIYITLGVVCVIIAVLALIHYFNSSSAQPTPATSNKSLVEQMTASGPSTLTPVQEKQLQAQMTATGPSTLTPAEWAKLKQQMTAKP